MKTPVVKKEGSRFCVEIGPQSFIRWWTEPRRDGLTMVIKIDAPNLTRYGRVDEADDRIEFPASGFFQ
jgi:hypothetical protein